MDGKKLKYEFLNLTFRFFTEIEKFKRDTFEFVFNEIKVETRRCLLSHTMFRAVLYS